MCVTGILIVLIIRVIVELAGTLLEGLYGVFVRGSEEILDGCVSFTLSIIQLMRNRIA